MKFIDKSRYIARENAINRKFLTDCLQPDGFFYPSVKQDASYSGFSHNKYRGPESNNPVTEPWISLLLQEQSNMCAYCMRRINAYECDVEHIVPKKSISPNDFNHYRIYAPQLTDRTVEANLFPVPSNQGVISSTTAFPHKIALANLVATCKVNNGYNTVHCDANNHRHNTKIIPICVAPEHTLYYTANGKCFVITNTGKVLIDETPATLNLNTSTLRAIRMAWYLAAVNNFSINEINHLVTGHNPYKLIEKLLKNHGEITESCDRILFSEQITCTPDIMESLMYYDWFYLYYKFIAPNVHLHQ